MSEKLKKIYSHILSILKNEIHDLFAIDGSPVVYMRLVDKEDRLLNSVNVESCEHILFATTSYDTYFVKPEELAQVLEYSTYTLHTRVAKKVNSEGATTHDVDTAMYFVRRTKETIISVNKILEE